MYKIACAADLHGFLPKIPPNIDLLIMAGDYVFTRKGDWQRQLRFINGPFHQWISELAIRIPQIILVAGNHDEVFEHHRRLINPFPENVTYLEDSGINWRGLNIWGSPQNLFFYNWSFNKRPSEIDRYWDMIPLNTDILVCHQPPYQYGDLTDTRENVGCYQLRDRILEVKPKLVVCGHIHNSYGTFLMNQDTTVVNCAYVGEDYKPKNPPIIFEI